MTASLYCVYRPPFGQLHPRVQRLPQGLTLAEISERMSLPGAFRRHGTICINGQPVPRGAWHLVKPKAMTRGIANAVTFHAPILGGGEQGGKNPLAILGGLALTVLSAGAAGGLFATAGGLFAAQTTSALLLAGGISLVGSLILNALVPPPTLGRDDRTPNRRDAMARGNILDPNGVVPRVIGERRVFPPLLMEPLVTFSGDDEVVEAVYGLSGPHRLRDMRVGATPVEDVEGLQIETREGWPGDAGLDLVRRYGRTQQVGQELRGHQVSADNSAQLDTAIDVALAVPQPITVATRPAPDVHELQIALPQGLGRPGESSDLVRVPIRIRIRRRGDADWRNLPEIHYQGADFRQLRATVRLVWADGVLEAPTAGAAKGFVAMFHSSPAQTTAPPAPGRQADDYFYAGSGATFVNQNNLGATGLRNYRMGRNSVDFILDPADWPVGVYEVEIVRGAAVRNAQWSDSNYQYAGQIRDLFGYFGTPPQIPFGRGNLTDTIAIQRSVSIWKRTPVATDDFALIAVRGRNTNIEQLSVLAGGWVRDYRNALPVLPPFDLAFDQGDEISGDTDLPFFARTRPLFAEFSVTFPSAPDGVIWEQGSAPAQPFGVFVGVTSGDLVFRAGDWSDPATTETAKFTIDAAPFAGRSGRLWVAINIAPDTITAWWRDDTEKDIVLLGTAEATDGFPAPFSSPQWTGSNPGGIGQAYGAVPEGESSATWAGEISLAQFWIDTVAPTAVADAQKAWTEWEITSNPAPHYRDVLVGAQNANPLPLASVDDAELIEWRAAAIAAGWSCNWMASDTSVGDAMRVIASCGYARPYMSDRWGVVRDYDRSAEAPVQLFTPRNSANFEWSKAFQDMPDGLRVTFDDVENDYQPKQISVFRPGITRDSGKMEQIRYEGFTVEADAIDRARYDLAQLELRATFFTIDVPPEALACRRGSLVGLVHDAIARQGGFGRVIEGGTDEVRLDARVDCSNEPEVYDVTNIYEVADVWALGTATEAQIRYPEGEIVIAPLANATGKTDVLEFDPPLADVLPAGVLVSTRVLATEYRRMLVFDMQFKTDYEARMTLVDESPEVFA